MSDETALKEALARLEAVGRSEGSEELSSPAPPPLPEFVQRHPTWPSRRLLWALALTALEWAFPISLALPLQLVALMVFAWPTGYFDAPFPKGPFGIVAVALFLVSVLLLVAFGTPASLPFAALAAFLLYKRLFDARIQ